MNWDLIKEAIKTPIRQVLLALYSFLVNKLFGFLLIKIGFEFTEEQKLQILGYGIPVVYAILSALDRFLHKLGQLRSTKKVQSGLVKGLTGF